MKNIIRYLALGIFLSGLCGVAREHSIHCADDIFRWHSLPRHELAMGRWREEQWLQVTDALREQLSSALRSRFRGLLHKTKRQELMQQGEAQAYSRRVIPAIIPTENECFWAKEKEIPGCSGLPAALSVLPHGRHTVSSRSAKPVVRVVTESRVVSVRQMQELTRLYPQVLTAGGEL